MAKVLNDVKERQKILLKKTSFLVKSGKTNLEEYRKAHSELKEVIKLEKRIEEPKVPKKIRKKHKKNFDKEEKLNSEGKPEHRKKSLHRSQRRKMKASISSVADADDFYDLEI